MMMNFSLNSQLSLTPLGAGDLIDRAVRFYRKNFWTLVLIAAPPVIIGMLFSVSWSLAARKLFSIGVTSSPDESFGYYMFLWLGGILIWIVESVATLVVMGGASRNFVRHLLFGEALNFKETYRNTWKRLGGLIVASLIITVILGIAGYFILSIGVTIAMFAIIAVGFAFSFSPFIITILSIILGLVFLFLTLWVFFLLASRFAYVPQVMLVEGQGAFSAIGRSATLASGNVKRLAALFIFTLVATYSALLLFYIPLGWLAWINGIEILSFSRTEMLPAWYEISNQIISQTSLILLSPVWMIGLCLLYVDERVRHEGYDIELMAARQLGEIPAVPQEFINPLQPALAQTNLTNSNIKTKSFSTLGLE